MFSTFLFLMFLFNIKGVNGIIGYDCKSSNSNITAISLLNTHECTTHNGSISETTFEGQVVQLHQYQPVHVFICSVEVIVDVFYCGSLSHVFRTTHPTRSYIKHIGKSQCEEAHKTGKLQVFNAKIQNLKPNSSSEYSETALGTTSDSGRCSNGKPGDIFLLDDGTKISEKVVQLSVKVRLSDIEETVSVVDRSVIIDSLGISCPANDGYCRDTLVGEVFWEFIPNGCFNRVDVLYEGEMKLAEFLDNEGESTSVISIESKSKLFSLKLEGYSILCGGTVIDTEHKRIKISKKDELSLYRFAKNSIYNRNVDLQYYIDSKFLYVTSSLMKRTEDIYKSIMENICQVRKQILENRLVLSQIRSDQVGQLIEKQSGVTASILGEVMYITSCEPVPVSFRKNAGCIQELPVFYKNKPMFLEPITHILTDTATETVCSKHMTPAFKLEDSWHTYNNELNRVILEPLKLNPNKKNQKWNFKSLLEISKSGLYDKEDLESLQKTMMFGTTRDAIQNNVAKTLYVNGKTGAGGGMDFLDQNSINSIGNKIGGFAWLLTSWIGDIASFLIGMFIVFKLIVFLLDTCLNCFNIYNRRGCTPWLICGWMSSVVHFLMHDIVFNTKFQKTNVSQKESVDEETETCLDSSYQDRLAILDKETHLQMLEDNEILNNMPTAPVEEFERGSLYPRKSNDYTSTITHQPNTNRLSDERAIYDAIARQNLSYQHT